MNPLFNALFGSKMPQAPAQAPQMQNQSQPDWNTLMGQLRSNPGDMLKNAGYNVPDEVLNDPRATVMHLMNSGQISNPKLQMIQPFLQRMGIR